MSDTVSDKRRSEIMSHIKSKNISIELAVRKELHKRGYRYRVNYKELPGKPDIVFTGRKKAIFIHGCYWNGHDAGCRYAHTSQTKQEYWLPKIARNKERDKAHLDALESMGWHVLVIWECEIKKAFEETMQKVIVYIS